MQLVTMFRGLRVHQPAEDELASVPVLGHPDDSDNTFFLDSGGTRSVVVAVALKIDENDRDIFDDGFASWQ